MSASIEEAESGESTSLSVSLLNSSEPTQLGSPDFALADSEQKVTLPSMSYMDDVPRETPNEEGLAETVDEFHTEEDFAIDMSSAEEESTEDFSSMKRRSTLKQKEIKILMIRYLMKLNLR